MRSRSYQLPGIKYCRDTQHPALFPEMRLGKTFITIRSIIQLKLTNNLIIAPFDAFSSWIKNLKEEKQTFSILEGIRKQRLDRLFQPSTWYIINYEGLLVIPEIFSICFNCVILDESTIIKDPKTKLSKILCKNFRHVKKRFILTGEPTPESQTDYFQQLKFLNSSILGINNYWHFQNKYFELENFKYVPTKQYIKKILPIIQKYCFFLKRKECGIMIKKNYKTYYCEPEKEFLKIQKELIKNLIVKVKGKEIKSTVYAPTKFIWLHQLAGGFIDDMLISTSKIKLLKKIINSAIYDFPIVIWANYLKELKLIKKIYPFAEIICGETPPAERRDITNRFMNGKVDLLVANPNCYKYGLDLSKAKVQIRYSVPLSYQTYTQAEDRLIHILDNKEFTIIDLVLRNSIDEYVIDLLKNKKLDTNYYSGIIRKLKQECIE